MFLQQWHNRQGGRGYWGSQIFFSVWWQLITHVPSSPGGNKWISRTHLTGQDLLGKILILVMFISGTVCPGVTCWLPLLCFFISPSGQNVSLLWFPANRGAFISQKYWPTHCEFPDFNQNLQLAGAGLALCFLIRTLLNNMNIQKKCQLLKKKIAHFAMYYQGTAIFCYSLCNMIWLFNIGICITLILKSIKEYHQCWVPQTLF